MAGERPSPFSTVPHGFHYHYQEEPPKTPERELAQENAFGRPPSARGFRVKRRSRLRINTSISSQTSEVLAGLQDSPLPSIEVSDQVDVAPAFSTTNARPNTRFLSPFQSGAMTVPRTPEPRAPNHHEWAPIQQQVIGQSIARPQSALSSLSDSSDDSLMSSEDGFSYGGSCTSPESDAADPFTFYTPTKMDTANEVPLGATIIDTKPKTKSKPRWTKEMENHIWAVYMSYLNDPTVTPFKTLPGIPPPVGVCHRVAREAKRTWKGRKTAAHTSFMARTKQLRRNGSPDTVTERSGSTTPTLQPTPKSVVWAGSGSATRKHFRELCKRKATFSPHYQRMLQSRSPSPFLTNNPRPASRSTRAGSPFFSRDSFGTRDVAVALSTSTASSMRPNAPLTRLSTQQNDEWFNDPDVPWASPAPIPSDIETGEAPAAASTFNLGSPFTGAHTWGPSNTRRQGRPNFVQAHQDSAPEVPRLRSPVHFASVPRAFASNFAPKTPKRPAQSELDDEVSGGEAQPRGNGLDDVFGGNFQLARRRIRPRGMSLEDRFQSTIDSGIAMVPSRPESMSVGPSISFPRPNSSPMSVDSDPFVSTSGSEAIRRLGSPFPGIGTRPTRARTRHMPSYSFSSYNPSDFESIEQRLDRSSHVDL